MCVKLKLQLETECVLIVDGEITAHLYPSLSTQYLNQICPHTESVSV